MIATSVFGIPPAINLLVLLVFTVVLLFYMNIMHVYINTRVLLLNSSFILNLIFQSGFFVLTEATGDGCGYFNGVRLSTVLWHRVVHVD